MPAAHRKGSAVAAAAPQEEPRRSEILHTAHSITFLALFLGYLGWLAFTRTATDNDTSHNVKVGLWAAVAAHTVYFCFFCQDGPMARPHVLFWRAFTSLWVLYMIILVFVCFQKTADVRSWFSLVDPSLGTPVEEVPYAEECDLYTPNDPESSFKNLRHVLLDVFVLAHVLGYIGKALMVRSTGICLALSLQFELVELSLQHMLENFKECWWDHVLVDVLICNAGGTWIGMQICRFLEAKHYRWDHLKDIPSMRGKAKRVLAQLTIPESFESLNWGISSSFKRFLQVSFLVVCMSAAELNSFLLKTVFWVPPSNFLNPTRLFFWGFIGGASVRDYYEFCSRPDAKRLGMHGWMALGTLAIELLVWAIHVRTDQLHLFQRPFPEHIKLAWLGIVLIWVAVAARLCLKSRKKKKN